MQRAYVDGTCLVDCSDILVETQMAISITTPKDFDVRLDRQLVTGNVDRVNILNQV